MTNSIDASLSRRVEKTSLLSIQDDSLRDALALLSDFCLSRHVSDYASLRSHLRPLVDETVLDTHSVFLQSVAQLMNTVAAADSEITFLRASCDRMKSQLASTLSETSSVVERAEMLRARIQSTQTRTTVVHRFLDEYMLTEAEVLLLKTGAIDDSFFVLMDKLSELRAKAGTLLQSSAHHRAALDLSEKLAGLSDAATKRLFKWAQEALRRLSDDAGDVPSQLPSALRVLGEQPVLLRACVEDAVQRLSGVVLREFLDALSMGGSQRKGMPIELHAHDTVRYVGDMCAWMHQEVVLCTDVCHVLFSQKSPNNTATSSTTTTTSARKSNSSSGGEMSAVVKDVLQRSFEGVGRQLRTRVMQIADARPSLSALFRIASILAFYDATIGGVVSFGDMLRHVHAAMLDTVKMHAERMLQAVPVVPGDLSPPHVLTDTVARLAELLQLASGTLTSSSSSSSTANGSALKGTDEKPEEQVQTVVAAILDPLVHVAVASAEEQLDATDGAVYLMNCFAVVYGELQRHRVTEAKAAQMRLHMDEQMRLFVQRQSEAIFPSPPHAPTTASAHSSTTPSENGSSNVGADLDWDAVSKHTRSFYASLFALGALAVPKCDRIQDNSLRAEARAAIARAIANTYARWYELAVASDADRAKEIMYHSPQQVAQLLDV
jgi:hypothetical protein